MWYSSLWRWRLTLDCPRRRRVALTLLVCLSLAVPWCVQQRAGAAAGDSASAGALRQPARAAVADALALAAANALPSGYPTLDGVPRVPPVLLEAIAWVESNWRQFRAPDSPLVGSGGAYGVMQVARAMHVDADGAPVDDPVGSAIANNYVYNIAAGARLLAHLWATTPRSGDGNPDVLENWYYAVWAYNAWGWRDNPTNPAYTRVDTPATHPLTFPYQERVFYYVAHPPSDNAGRPLWTAVPVTLPPSGAIGRTPATLPAPHVAHTDPAASGGAPPSATLALPSGDGAAMRTDLSLPSGTTVAPGAALHKAWLVRNTGGAFWSGYTWTFTGGDRMGVPMTTTVPYAPPLADVTLGVDLVAPSRPGAYTGYWQLHDSMGQPVGQPATVSLVVANQDAATPGSGDAVVGGAAPPCLAGIASPGVSVAEGALLDNARFARDLSVPDCTIIAPGAVFTKTWEIRNTGTTTWDSRYHWHFEAGAALGPTRAVAAPSAVAPGATAVFSVRMAAPSRPHAYIGYWQMTGPTGAVFGAQSWVNIRVGAAPAATATPPTGATPAATATPSATATPAPSPIPNGGAAQPPTPVGTPPAASVPWFGPATNHAFLAEGYTGAGYQEYLSLLNPRGRTLRAQVTIYRADGATRVLSPLRLAPYTRQTFNINILAPRASTALKIEGDGPLVAERALYSGRNGSVVACAPLPSRHWYVAEGYVGANFSDGLRIFNPYDVSAPVTVTTYQSDGAARVSHRIVAGTTRLSVALDDIAPTGGSALTVDSALPIVVESTVRAAGTSGPTAALALTAPSRQWYFPDGGAKNGDREYISVYNPDSRHKAAVSLRFVTGDGYQAPLTLHPGPHARAVFVIGGLIHQDGVAAVVTSDRPVVAQETRYMSRGGLALVDGATRASRSWSLADGYVGQNFKEWITLLNPNAHAVTTRVRLIGRDGVRRAITVRQRPHWRDYLYLNGRLPNGPVAALVDADSPIVAGRTLLFNGDKGLSTTIGVALSGW